MEVVTECLVHDSGEATTSVMSIYHSSRLFVYTCWPAGTIVGGVYSTANFENVKSGYHYLTAAKDEQ